MHYRIAATLFPRDMVCFRNISVNTLLKMMMMAIPNLTHSFHLFFSSHIRSSPFTFFLSLCHSVLSVASWLYSCHRPQASDREKFKNARRHCKMCPISMTWRTRHIWCPEQNFAWHLDTTLNPIKPGRMASLKMTNPTNDRNLRQETDQSARHFTGPDYCTGKAAISLLQPT